MQLTLMLSIFAVFMAASGLYYAHSKGMTTSDVSNIINESFPQYISNIVKSESFPSYFSTVTNPTTYIRTEVLPAPIPFIHCSAVAFPTVKNAPMPSSSWQVMANYSLALNVDGTVTVPSSGMYTVSVSQENRINASVISIMVVPPGGTYSNISGGTSTNPNGTLASGATTRYYGQSAPATGIGNSPMSVTVSFHAYAGSLIAPLYNWGTTSNFTTGSQTIFSITKSS